MILYFILGFSSNTDTQNSFSFISSTPIIPPLIKLSQNSIIQNAELAVAPSLAMTSHNTNQISLTNLASDDYNISVSSPPSPPLPLQLQLGIELNRINEKISEFPDNLDAKITQCKENQYWV